MKFLAALVFSFCFISEGLTQNSLSDYSFVIVPEKFDFVDEKDKYQLNSLTKFLFDKHGFNAYFESERPNVKRCDGLYAVVEGKPAMIRTKVVVILNDCYGEEVYRTAIGKSKLKAYNKTYTAALRQAFLSIDSLDIQQREPLIFGAEDPKEETKTEVPAETIIEASEAEPIAKEDVFKVVEATKEVTYSNNGSYFLLKSTKVGYSLFERFDESATLKGTITQKADQSFQFIDATGNKFPCRFDTDQNLIIETSFQNIIFTREDQ